MNTFVEELKYDLLKRVRMGQGLKKVNDWVAIDCRLLSIWKENGDGLIEVRYVESEDKEENPKITIRVLNSIGEKVVEDLGKSLEETAELVEGITEKWCEMFPDNKLEWDWLGN